MTTSATPASLPVTVTVRDVNEGPEIARTGSAPGSVPENYDPAQVLARYTATDPEGGTVSNWRTSGTDGGDFVISEQGELRFRNVPDHERPADSNRDNSYVFTVQVSDGQVYGNLAETVTVITGQRASGDHDHQRFGNRAQAGREPDVPAVHVQGHRS